MPPTLWPNMAEMARGTLFLVVGPSGAGKDTLLDAARAVLAPDGAYVFPQREITRPADAGGEAHIAIDTQAFAAKKAAGGYALCWDAHGLHYGIDADIVSELAAGRHVVCNVSRGAVEAARACFQPMRVVLVTASLATLAARIAARGRESAEEIEARLLRSAAQEPLGPDVSVIENDATLEEAVAAFMAALGASALPRPTQH